MTILVVLSHYFAEIRGGVGRLGVGYVAVDGFFVLSGLLVGRLILDKQSSRNFFLVFYVRRVCRTFPTFFLTLIAVLGLCALCGLRNPPSVPTWSYFTFTNNFFMAAHRAIGAEWLGPTWTMAVEEQFYLVVPFLLIITPRRLLPLVLASITGIAVAFRLLCLHSTQNAIAALVLLPSRADNLAIGLGSAVLLGAGVEWNRLRWRVAPVVVGFAVAAGLFAFGPQFLTSIGHTLLCMGLAVFLMTLVDGAPEAKRFEDRRLRFLGDMSYATYLTHMPVLWFMHWLCRGAEPSLSTGAGVVLTVLSLPVTFVVSYLLTRFLEQPVSALGRRMKWECDARSRRPLGVAETRESSIPNEAGLSVQAAA